MKCVQSKENEELLSVALSVIRLDVPTPFIDVTLRVPPISRTSCFTIAIPTNTKEKVE